MTVSVCSRVLWDEVTGGDWLLYTVAQAWGVLVVCGRSHLDPDEREDLKSCDQLTISHGSEPSSLCILTYITCSGTSRNVFAVCSVNVLFNGL